MTDLLQITALDDATDDVDIDGAIDTLLYSLSETSRRIYARTYTRWLDFAEANDVNPMDLRAKNLIAFLEMDDLSHSTKSARLSHMRRLIQALYAERPDNVALQSMMEQSKLLKVKRRAEDVQTERNKVALTRQQVYAAFSVWDADRLLHVRNRALLAILFYGGLRRSEAAVLMWNDIDLDGMLLHIRHGKGDKTRTIPLLGGEDTREKIQAWREATLGRTYVFCGMRKGDTLTGDTPMSDQAVYDVIKATSDAVGVDFAPHDARRTLLTRMLSAGTSVSDAQFIAGHSDPQTTLRYAVVKDANEVRGRVKLDY